MYHLRLYKPLGDAVKKHGVFNLSVVEARRVDDNDSSTSDTLPMVR